MRLFGGLLPFIGFRMVPAGAISLEDGPVYEYEQEVFEVEWFGFGIRFMEKEPVRK